MKTGEVTNVEFTKDVVQCHRVIVYITKRRHWKHTICPLYYQNDHIIHKDEERDSMLDD